MSTIPPPNLRFDTTELVADQPENVRRAHTIISNKLVSLTQGLAALSTKVKAIPTATSSSSSSTTSVTMAQATAIANAQAAAAITDTLPVSLLQNIGNVSDQSTLTAYQTLVSDNGNQIIVNSASAIAIALNSAVTRPWFTFVDNQGTGTATLTPTTGTISYPGNSAASSMPVAGGYLALVNFDGVNWWGAAVPSTVLIAGVTSLNALTGGLSLTSTGSTITITPSGSAIDLEVVAATNYVKGNVSIGPEGGSGTYTASGSVAGATVGAVVAVGVSNGTEAGIFSNLLGWVTTAGTVNIQVTSNASFLLTSLPVVVFV